MSQCAPNMSSQLATQRLHYNSKSINQISQNHPEYLNPTRKTNLHNGSTLQQVKEETIY